eukprot:m.120102 g.120102  ORF g.120102 m.120102 type:complete len:570 (-) comp14346_c0_seq4:38-1747(-)
MPRPEEGSQQQNLGLSYDIGKLKEAAIRRQSKAQGSSRQQRTHSSFENRNVSTSVESTKSLQQELNIKNDRIASLEVEVREKENKILSLENQSNPGGDVHKLEEELNNCNKSINRHLSFIDRLINDKKELAKQCEHLVEKLRTSESKFNKKLDALKATHQREILKQKEVEKSKREKWVKEQTRRIKEITMKGLEPEIQKIMDNHKVELEKAQEIQANTHDENLKRLQEDHQKKIDDLRVKLESEKQSALMEEVRKQKDYFRQMAEEEERSFHTKIKKLKDELAQERESHRQALQEQCLQADIEKRIALETSEQEHRLKLSEVQRDKEKSDARCEKEKLALREQFDIEKQNWEEMFIRKQKATLKTREEEFRDRLRTERDKQIDAIIDKFEAEIRRIETDAQEQADLRVNRLREKFNMQIRDVELSEQNCLDRYNKVRLKLAETLEECTTIKGVQKKIETELDRERQLTSKLLSEKDNVRQVIREEFTARIDSQENQIETLKAQLATIKTKNEAANGQWEDRYQEIQRHHEEELDAQRQELGLLREQYEAALRRADHAEELLIGQGGHEQ